MVTVIIIAVVCVAAIILMALTGKKSDEGFKDDREKANEQFK